MREMPKTQGKILQERVKTYQMPKEERDKRLVELDAQSEKLSDVGDKLSTEELAEYEKEYNEALDSRELTEAERQEMAWRKAEDDEILRQLVEQEKELWNRPCHKLTTDDFFITDNRHGFYSLRWRHNNRRVTSARRTSLESLEFQEGLRRSYFPDYTAKTKDQLGEEADPVEKLQKEAIDIIKALNSKQFDKEWGGYYCLNSFYQSKTLLDTRKYDVYSIKEKEVQDKTTKGLSLFGFIKGVIKGE